MVHIYCENFKEVISEGVKSRIFYKGSFLFRTFSLFSWLYPLQPNNYVLCNDPDSDLPSFLTESFAIN